MKRLEVDELAQREFDEAFEWYLDQRAGLAQRLEREIRAAFEKIATRPGSFPRVSKRARRCRLDRFWYSVVFQEFPDRIRIIAFAHSSRRPLYWRNRQQ